MDRAAYLDRRLRVAVITPVLLLVLAAGILTYEIARLVDASRWVDHTDQVIGAANEAEKLVSDQEATLRGYLLTHDEQFTRAFQKTPARAQIVEMRRLSIDNATQTRRVDDLLRLYDLWLPTNLDAIDASAAGLREREAKMDDLRARFRGFTDEETLLRRERAAILESANTTAGIVSIALLVLLAGSLAFVSRKQIRDINTTFVQALDMEQAHRAVVEGQATMRAALVRIVEAMQGELDEGEIAERALRELVATTNADVGAFYVLDGTTFRLRAGHALRENAPKTIALGEGIIGQCAREKKLTRKTDVPRAYLDVVSGVGEHASVELVVVPCVTDRVVYAVAELAFLRPAESNVDAVLERASEAIGVAVRSASLTARLHELLEESRRQAEELQTQQEELRAINEELQHQSEEVARASRYKSEFLANISHELRTPLNSSLILAELLASNKTENLTREQVEYAHTIHSAGKDLLALIDDILDLAKIESGTVKFEITRTTLRDVVEPVVSLFRPIAAEKKLAFEVDAKSSEPIHTDAKRVQQVLKNLLANAFKFTSAGKVEVRTRVFESMLEIVVRDTGIGIPASERERIFDAFHQAHGGPTRRFAGSGLGLAISRDLVRGLDGTIRVDSVEGQGSTFTVRLPTTEPTPVPARTTDGASRRPARERDAALDGTTVLVAEDDVRGVFALSSLLESHGASVMIARTGNEATSAASKHKIDLVLIASSMPTTDDVAPIERIRRANAELPIVAITAKGTPADQERCLRAGASDYIGKPFDDAMLLSLVQMWVKK